MDVKVNNCVAEEELIFVNNQYRQGGDQYQNQYDKFQKEIVQIIKKKKKISL